MKSFTLNNFSLGTKKTKLVKSRRNNPVEFVMTDSSAVQESVIQVCTSNIEKLTSILNEETKKSITRQQAILQDMSDR